MTTTRKQIKELRDEAALAGDMAQVTLCEAALAGNEDAILKCRLAIEDARAQVQDGGSEDIEDVGEA